MLPGITEPVIGPAVGIRITLGRRNALAELLRQARLDDPERLQPEPEALAVLCLHRVKARQVAYPLEAIRDRVAVRVDRRRGRVHVAVLAEIGLERAHKL